LDSLALTELERKFVNLYVMNNFTANEAVTICGYNTQTAYNLLKRNDIMEAITKITKEIDLRHAISFDYKIQKLKHIIELCAGDAVDSFKEADTRTAIAAIAELNKMQGHYAVEKHQHTNINLDVDVETTKVLLDEMRAKHKQEY
jgi:phage terminase small subunit